MLIRQLRIWSFRGWSGLELRPGSHALLVGVPRAGRSDLIEALRRVLDQGAQLMMTPALQRRGLAAGGVYVAGQGAPQVVWVACGGIRSVRLAAIVAAISTTMD